MLLSGGAMVSGRSDWDIKNVELSSSFGAPRASFGWAGPPAQLQGPLQRVCLEGALGIPFPPLRGLCVRPMLGRILSVFSSEQSAGGVILWALWLAPV